LKKQIAFLLAVGLVIGSMPARTEGATTMVSAGRQETARTFRDSVDRAVAAVPAGDAVNEVTGAARPEQGAPGPELTGHERRDLAERHDALRTDPVARGTGGIILLVVGIAASIAITAWAIHHYSNDNTTTPTPAMARR
jgi:hypothetical protein